MLKMKKSILALTAALTLLLSLQSKAQNYTSDSLLIEGYGKIKQFTEVSFRGDSLLLFQNRMEATVYKKLSDKEYYSAYSTLFIKRLSNDLILFVEEPAKGAIYIWMGTKIRRA